MQSNQNEKLKQATVYIIDKCQNKKNFGLKVLHKLLYFSDFAYYKKQHTSITGGTYKRFVYGPFIPALNEVLLTLETEGKIIATQETLSKTVTKNNFKSVGTIDVSSLSEDERAEIDNILAKLGSMNGTEIENLSHQDVPWQVTDEGEIIDYDLVFYRDDEISAKVE
jgi:uncharacterized phage-associated protein